MKRGINHSLHTSICFMLLLNFWSCTTGTAPVNTVTDSTGKTPVIYHSRDSVKSLSISEKIIHSEIHTCIYDGDSLLYCGYKFDHQYLFPRKGHGIFVDSAYVKIPYD